MKNNFDVIVIGCGAMGSSTCAQLAQKGIRVLGIEQFQRTHDRGSSHGETRMIRKAYFEHPSYVPLLNRSYELWEELNEFYQNKNPSLGKLFHKTGLLMGGLPGSEILNGVKRSSELYQLPIEKLTLNDVQNKFPQFKSYPYLEYIYEPEGGYLEVENCIKAYWSLAQEKGATFCENEKVVSLKADTHSIELKTEKNTYTAKKVIITAGAWASEVIGEIPIQVHQNFLYWFDADQTFEEKNGFCCFGFHFGDHFYYGFPALKPSHQIKIALHLPGPELPSPDFKESKTPGSDLEHIQNFMGRVFPNIKPEPSRFATCLYSMTPDGHFILDEHPEYSNIFMACGFSGHGFKFSSVIGEICTQWSINCLDTTKKTYPIEFLSLKRFK